MHGPRMPNRTDDNTKYFDERISNDFCCIAIGNEIKNHCVSISNVYYISVKRLVFNYLEINTDINMSLYVHY